MPAVAGRGRGRRTINEINMVPFIDVMLVLLIIFMVTAPLITPSMIDLPSVGKASRQPDQIIQIVIGKDDKLEMKVKEQTTPLVLKDLAAAVKRAQGAKDSVAAAGSAVVISADKTVKYESVVQVMDTLQRAGIQRVGLSVQLAN
ncbi:ExbD/TolR family protein [Rhodoferax saidenbachensis]|uniref:Biopolymer transport protein TolR n=1 Tax=Rhodoferax saidenbachensis TaxID=1484693 RepID=A0ABU1ZIZ3_9BURK|nr:ExbD/TolR family protein [Rhodoferax saidenbachensis]MDR7304916.1 biopolymer transport protein TolR [Rhodoferax saidenbachensis]